MNYTIIIPVHNGFEFVKPCIESVLRNSPPECTVKICDDGSTDKRTADYLQLLRKPPILGTIEVLVYRRENAVGFVKTVNRELALTTGDVIVLNSDTIVPTKWIDRLHEARNSVPYTAAVCPLSNNATICSVPNSGAQELPSWLSVDEMDRIVNETSECLYPTLPVLQGFCMLLTREALNAVGVFDEIFGRGYGEEVDWSLRARAADFEIVLCDDLFVWHRGHASFGDNLERDALRERAAEIVLARWPEYPDELRSWHRTSPLRKQKTRIVDRLRSRPKKKRPKVLYLMHNWGGYGGIEIYTRRLVKELDDRVEFTILHPSRGDIETDALVTIEHELGDTPRITMNCGLVGQSLNVGMFPFSSQSKQVEYFFHELLEGLYPDVVHFQHLAGFGSFDLPRIAKEFGCKVIWGMHDDFQLCPLLRLGGACQSEECLTCDKCLECMKSTEGWLVLKQIHDDEILEIMHERSVEITKAAEFADVITTPSEHLKQTSKTVLFNNMSKVRVMSPGFDLDRVVDIYRRCERLRVGWFGAGSINKGFETFLEACRLLNDKSDYEFSVHAPLQQEISLAGCEHVRFFGPFADGTLGTILQTVDVAVVAAMRNETYGLIVDEVVGHGVPAIVAAVPAIEERYSMRIGSDVIRYEWGNVTELLDALDIMLMIWKGGQLERRSVAMKTMVENASEHAELYRELIG